MTSRKPGPRKKRLLKADNSNRRVPAWVMIRSGRRVSRHPKQRTWRRNNLKK